MVIKSRMEGKNFEATELSSDKYLFHKKLNENGLRYIKLYLINKDTDFEKISIPYPAIMKPRFGSGSRDVYYITNDDELKKAYDKAISLDEDFVLEEAFQGTEYGVDLAVVDDEVHLVLVRGKSMTPLPERQEVAYFSTTRDSENAELTEKIKEKFQYLGICKLSGFRIIMVEVMDYYLSVQYPFLVYYHPGWKKGNTYSILESL